MKTTYVELDAVGRIEVNFSVRVVDTVDRGLPAFDITFHIHNARFVGSELVIPNCEFHWIADEMYEQLTLGKKFGEIAEPGYHEDAALDYQNDIEQYFSWGAV